MMRYRYAPTALVGLGAIQQPEEKMYQSQIQQAIANTRADNGLTRGLELGGMLAQSLGGMMQGFGLKGMRNNTAKAFAGNDMNKYNSINKTIGDIGDYNSLMSGVSSIGNMFGMFALGGRAVQGEAEGGELLESPNGQMYDINGPKHEDGGVPISMDELSRIYSGRVKIDGVSIADRTRKRVKHNARLEDILYRDPYNTILRKSWERGKNNTERLKAQEMALQEQISKILSYG